MFNSSTKYVVYFTLKLLLNLVLISKLLIIADVVVVNKGFLAIRIDKQMYDKIKEEN